MTFEKRREALLQNYFYRAVCLLQAMRDMEK